MWISIKPLSGEYSQAVKEILSTNTDIYGNFEDYSFLNTHLYEIDNENGDLIAFFGLSYWDTEVVISCVWVHPDWRRQGIFKTILKYAKKIAPKDHWLVLNASNTNVLANQIYAHLLEYSHLDAKENVHWYIVRKIKKRGGN